MLKKISFEDTKVSNIGKNGTLLSISRILNLGISMLVSMLLARFRTLTEYGTMSEITTVVSIAIAVVCIGLPSCLNYFVPRCENQQERNEFISFYYFINTFLGVITGIVLLLTTPLIAKYYNNNYIITYSYALAALPLCVIMQRNRDNLFVSTNQCTRAIVYNLVQTLSNLGIILLTQFLEKSFSFYFFLYIIDNIVFTVLIYFEAGRLVDRVSFHFTKTMLIEVLKYSIPLGVSSAVATIDLDLDRLMIGYLFDTDKVAIYTNCGKELPIVYIATSFSAVLLPIIVRRVKERKNTQAVELWGKTVEFSMIIIGFFTAACVAFAPQIVTFMYSEKYLAGVTIFRIYSLVLLFRVTAFAMILQALGKTKSIMLISIVALVLNLGMNLGMYYLIGFEGPAVATLLTIAINCFLLLYLTCKDIGIGFREVFPWKKILYILLINVIGTVLMLLIIETVGIGTTWVEIVEAIVLGVVWMIAYAFVFRKRIIELWKDMKLVED